jgi:hypothetical protein
VSLLFSVLASIAGSAAAAAPAPESVLQGYRACYPAAASLGLYSLDWVRGLDAARQRASREGRPILLIVVRNISGGGDVYTGHC